MASRGPAPRWTQLPNFPGDEPLGEDSGSSSEDMDLAQADTRHVIEKLATSDLCVPSSWSEKAGGEDDEEDSAKGAAELVGTLRELAELSRPRMSSMSSMSSEPQKRCRRTSTFPRLTEKASFLRRIRSEQTFPQEPGLVRDEALEAVTKPAALGNVPREETEVRFLPGTHYLATAGRDHMLKLWDCDSYEVISTLAGHATEILAMALSQDAAFIITAGNDKQIRMWKRTQEQLFLSEERAKELEDQFEQEVEREDLQATTAAPRPSRRTVESVRTTERLMEVLDEAKAAEEQLEADGLDPQSFAEVGQGARHPCARAIAYINTLNSNIYEVLLALPFSHAVLLLKVILRFFEAVSALPGGEGAEARSKALSAAATLQTPCQAALIAAYVHHSELATSNCRPMLLRLKQEMQKLLQAEKDRIGLTMAGLSHLQCLMKRSGMPLATSGDAKDKPSTPRGKAKVAKRRRK